MGDFAREAKRKGKMSSKMEKEIAEIEGMMDSMENMGQAYGSQLSKLEKKTNQYKGGLGQKKRR